MKQLSNYSLIQANLIIDELIKHHITTFFVSPGKRNIPLISALEHSTVDIITCIDERNAAFQALGYSKIHRKPAVLICTSGSALSHYYPAILEAQACSTPLLIISADRPKELVYTHANQSIHQDNFFNLPTHDFFYFPPMSDQTEPHYTKRILSHIAQQLLNNKTIHINCAFKEPLDGSKHPINKRVKQIAKQLLDESSLYTQYHSAPLITDQDRQTAIVIGANGELAHAKKYSHTYFFADITATKYTHLSNFHPDSAHFEQLIKDKKITKIIHIGGRVTSNKYYTLLKQYSIQVILIAADNRTLIDPAGTQKHVYPKIKFKTPYVPKNRSYHEYDLLLTSAKNFIPTTIAYKLWHDLPLSEYLVLGNSLTIRTFDIIPKEKARHQVITQRGVSGIDGQISLAIGIAQSTSKRVHLILGDISALHNLNALYDIDKSLNISIYILNNSGGQIFNLLKLKQANFAQQAITNTHNYSFSVNNQNIKHYMINNMSDFQQLLQKQKTFIGPQLIECLIDPKTEKQNFINVLATWK